MQAEYFIWILNFLSKELVWPKRVLESCFKYFTAYLETGW